jgi:hypothetical protein
VQFLELSEKISKYPISHPQLFETFRNEFEGQEVQFESEFWQILHLFKQGRQIV